ADLLGHKTSMCIQNEFEVPSPEQKEPQTDVEKETHRCCSAGRNIAGHTAEFRRNTVLMYLLLLGSPQSATLRAIATKDRLLSPTRHREICSWLADFLRSCTNSRKPGSRSSDPCNRRSIEGEL